MSKEDYGSEWHVLALAFIFFVLFCGNTFTVGLVVIKKVMAKRNFFWRNDILDKYRYSGAFGHSSSGTATNSAEENKED